MFDQAGKSVQLTENITMYNVFVDPAFIWDKQQFIDIITPVIYKHLCVVNGMQQVDLRWCVQNIEKYTLTELLPDAPDFFYLGSGIVTSGYETYDWTWYYQQIDMVLSGFTTGTAYQLIQNRLDQRIQLGIKKTNYLGFFTDEVFLKALQEKDFPYITVLSDNYVYIIPDSVRDPSSQSEEFRQFLRTYGYVNDFPNLEYTFYPQENRYVRILNDANPIIAQDIKDLKNTYYGTLINRVPILHGLGLEPYTKRYYPYGSFLSHSLWYVNKNGQEFYGIEQYFDDFLDGKDGEIIGRASAFLGQVGANDFHIQDAVNGGDVFLTIDPGVQKEIEMVAKKYQEQFTADSVSILVYDPYSGYVVGSATYPTYDPNNFDDAYVLQALSQEYGRIIDNETYIDIPVYVKTGGITRLATTVERTDTSVEKYMASNFYGPQVFVDRNIAMPYEPGSIFKAFTIGIGYDTDEIRLYDFYNDPGQVQVGIYTIRNVEEACLGDHSFLNAFVWSCNVGMVRIAQRVGEQIFYNYVSKLGFGQLTNIQLGGEEAGFVEGVSNVSLARFLNNTFGQGLLATPIQIAAAYWSLLNGWYYVQPTIVAGLRDGQTQEYIPYNRTVLRQIFKPETAEALKEALFDVLVQNDWLHSAVWLSGYSLGWKSGTSQIAFRGKYQQGIGWTNASFVGLITKDDPRYVVVVQVRRPRSSQWGGQTAGRIFRDVASFMVTYELIDQ